MKTINQFLNFRLIAILFATLFVVSCGDDDDGVEAPDDVNEVEVITNVTLIFTPEGGGLNAPVMVTAIDPDGEGAQELMVSGPINLDANTEYTLTYVIQNTLDPEDVEDIAEEILEEDDEHQFFYSFTMNAFTSPMGSGNIGAPGEVNYLDEDENGLPVGLETSWTTGDVSTGTFTARLQHQPVVNDNVVKTATSGSDDGDTDFDLTFMLNIQ